MIGKKPLVFEKIDETIRSIDISKIPEVRKPVLQELINLVQDKKDKLGPVHLNFVCTHNSRRSHLAQIWAQTLASYFGVPNVYCYSGGTEATAMFPKIVETLSYQGFEITALSSDDANNPVYSIKYNNKAHPIIGFSKTYHHAFNPKTDFTAIMTCSHADENCPFIPGAEQRIPFTFDDPKEFDGRPLQNEKYRERSLEIATELYYVFSKLN